MSSPTDERVGSILSLRRYPVKSMMGEELDSAEVTDRGLVGDRAYALVDVSTGKLVSAKNPKKWPGLFAFKARTSPLPQPAGGLQPVQIELPDGTNLDSGQDDFNRIVSEILGCEVKLETVAPKTPTLEEYWPDIEELALLPGGHGRGTVTDEEIVAGTFFDGAAVHLLTTATLAQLHEIYPEGSFQTRRFRPNIVVETPSGCTGFVEDSWIGHALAIGDDVRLGSMRPCPRCVMTTLPQGDLVQDSGILRTAIKHNEGNVGIYASVVQGGTIRPGDVIRRVD